MATCVDKRLPCRGTVIGILKALLGLSASAYTTVYVAFLEPDASKFLLLLAIGPSAVALLCVPFVNFVPFIQVEPHTKVCFRSLMLPLHVAQPTLQQQRPVTDQHVISPALHSRHATAATLQASSELSRLNIAGRSAAQ